MQLIGSGTSPFVRRIRLLMQGENYQFVSLDIYGEGRDTLRRSNPALKIPILIDGDQEVYDSRVIARYLSEKNQWPALTWDQENQLTLIDGANDSAVILVLSTRSGVNNGEGVMFFDLQRERIMTTLRTLSAMVDAGEFEEWNYPAICLFCLIDWLEFRDLVDFQGVESLLEFRNRNRYKPWVKETDPRQ